MEKRISTLDSLRGIAALFVVIFHYTYRFRVKFGHDYSSIYDLKIGFYGVELFFIISGFVIYMTVEKCNNGFDFAFKRFTRLYPTYWLCLLISFTFLYFFGAVSQKPTFTQLLFNFSMIQYLLHVKSVDGVYWTLLTELIFYFMIFLLTIFNQLKNIYIWGIIWLGLSVFSSFYSLIYHATFLKFAGLFYSGVIFYKIYSGTNTLRNHFMILLSYIVVLYNFRVQPYSLIVITVIYLLFYGFILGKLGFLNNKVLRYAGLISYPLYLLHQQIGYTIMIYLKPILGDGVIIILISLAFSIALASIVSIYFEKPIIKAVRSYISRLTFFNHFEAANKQV